MTPSDILLFPLFSTPLAPVLVLDFLALWVLLAAAGRFSRRPLGKSLAHFLLTPVFLALILAGAPLVERFEDALQVPGERARILALLGLAAGAEVLMRILIGGYGFTAFPGFFGRVGGFALGLGRGVFLCLLLVLLMPQQLRAELNLDGRDPQLLQPLSGFAMTPVWQPVFAAGGLLGGLLDPATRAGKG